MPAASTNKFDPAAGGSAVTGASLGAATEASAARVSPSFYSGSQAGVHNMGHVLIANTTTPSGQQNRGVMIDTSTAARDPVFYRWHQHIDNRCFNSQQGQPADDFSDAPKVQIRSRRGDATRPYTSSDIILAFKDKLPGAAQSGFDGQALASSISEAMLGTMNSVHRISRRPS